MLMVALPKGLRPQIEPSAPTRKMMLSFFINYHSTSCSESIAMDEIRATDLVHDRLDGAGRAVPISIAGSKP